MLTRYGTVLGLALLLVMLWNSSGRSQQPPPSGNETGQPQQAHPHSAQQQPAGDQRGTEQLPLVVKNLPTPKTETEATQERKDREDRAANDKAIESFNQRLIIIGVLQLIVFVGQLFVFGYQALKLRQTVKTMEDTAKRELRAYIGVEPRGVNWYVGSEFLVGHFAVRNVGRVLAKNISIFSTIEWGQDVERTTFSLGKIIESKIALPPRAKMIFGTDIGFDIDNLERNEIISGFLGYFYVWGKVTYTDEFGTVGWTEFCHRYPCAMIADATHIRVHRKYARYHEFGGNEAH